MEAICAYNKFTMIKNIKFQLANLPNKPGIYIFRGNTRFLSEAKGSYLSRDNAGQILYIGKANSIKKRVQSYFRDSSVFLPRITKMVSQIKKIDFIETGSEIEALLFESELIKKQKPKYNSQWKDDKNFLYIKVDKGDFPGVSLDRKPKAKSGQYFGPFTDAIAVRKTLNFLRRIFPYRSCNKMPAKSCLWYHINRCEAPCANKISQKEYQKIISQITLFLKGKVKKIIGQLKKEMRAVAKNKEYERAAVLRDRIFALEHIREVNILQKEQEQGAVNSLLALVLFLKKYFPILRLHPAFRIEAYDISNISGKLTTGSMIVFLDGKKTSSEYRMFKIKTVTSSDDVASMKEVLSRRFKHQGWVMPDLILLDGGKGQIKAAYLAQKESGITIPYIALAKKEEEIYIPGRSLPIKLKFDSSALLLLRAVRDEAHRFAKKYHLKLRSKKMIP